MRSSASVVGAPRRARRTGLRRHDPGGDVVYGAPTAELAAAVAANALRAHRSERALDLGAYALDGDRARYPAPGRGGPALATR